jgi:D-arabinose 1-dehydrogenase-like Zn-dependent alcohol dehydrogenase
VERFPLERANEALAKLREGKISGAAVLVIDMGRAVNGTSD